MAEHWLVFARGMSIGLRVGSDVGCWTYDTGNLLSAVSLSLSHILTCSPTDPISGFFTKGDNWSCTQIQTTQLPGDASVTVAFANPINVAWQASDLDKFVPPSAPILALASQTGGSVTPASSSTSSSAATSPNTGNSGAPSPTNANSSDLSTGATAGIGVGAAVAGLAIVVGIVYWFFRRHKSTQNPPKADLGIAAEKRDIYGENTLSPMVVQPTAELDAHGHVYEAPNILPVEAPTESSLQELEGDMVPELSQDGSRWTSMKSVSRR